MAGLKKQNRDGFIHHLCWPKGKTKHLSHKVLYLTSDTPVLCLSFSSSWCEQAIFAQHVALREWHEGTWILAWTEVRNLFLPWHCSNKLSVKFYSHQGKKKVQSMWWGMQPQPWVTICFPDWWIAGATWKPSCKRNSVFHIESPDGDCKELIISPAFDFVWFFGLQSLPANWKSPLWSACQYQLLHWIYEETRQETAAGGLVSLGRWFSHGHLTRTGSNPNKIEMVQSDCSFSSFLWIYYCNTHFYSWWSAYLPSVSQDVFISYLQICTFSFREKLCSLGFFPCKSVLIYTCLQHELFLLYYPELLDWILSSNCGCPSSIAVCYCGCISWLLLHWDHAWCFCFFT